MADTHHEKAEHADQLAHRNYMTASPEPYPPPSTRPRSPVATAPPKVIRPPPFSRRLTKSLFIRAADTRGPSPGYWKSLRSAATYSWINVLLVFNPISWALHYTHQTDGAVFAVALLGIIPLAGLLGHGTETIALFTGDALGGLINASLGNATEFIIAILLLVKCEIRVVQASLLGGLLSNLLLVTGMAFLVGGIRFSEQEFQQSAAQLNTSLMTLAVIALVLPTVFAIAIEQASGQEEERDIILEMSRGSAIILIFIYVSYMVFQLYSHSFLYNPGNDVLLDSPRSSTSSDSSSEPQPAEPHPTVKGGKEPAITPAAVPSSSAPADSASHPLHPQARRHNSLPFGSRAALGWGARQAPPLHPRVSEKQEEQQYRQAKERMLAMHQHDLEARARIPETIQEEEKESPDMCLPVAVGVLIAATGLTYLTAEALTDSLEGIGQTGAVSTEWLGLILLAIVGNAAEHVTAVFVAYRNKVDLALAVSVGSCIQIALFVIPILVLIGWIADKPLSLLFDPLEVVTLFLSVLLVRFATEDGRTHYMSGILLFGSYVLIAFSFWYYPQGGTALSSLYEEC
ncbi:calcium/proton exchanger [Cylindrobasidium torrendii FP15055 ss-10]|uniref:Calcium/proton exchanger n=1 Tax=Cylindrobasidium torrendii FP15055 ss-10 TaxID=1314674 RepID=A0A0D7BRM5_9AGAR|nr:calcium/proton exchanger [Cylindrobasidium torrendii FP15055 ss-10]